MMHTVSVQRLKQFGQYHLIDAPLLDEVKPCGYVSKIIDALPKTSAVTQDTSRESARCHTPNNLRSPDRLFGMRWLRSISGT